jgi:hypothetical protein
MSYHDYCNHRVRLFSRRDMLRTLSAGFGYLAFAGLASADSPPTASVLLPRSPHFPPRAKRVIFLCMRGGPSHVDTFDYKPRLIKDDGKVAEAGVPWRASPWTFRQRGRSGLWISDLFPNVAEIADDLCLLRGMHCDQPAHAQAFIQMHTGSAQFVRPSMGAWTLYGLGTENQNLPGFICINPPTANGGARNYASAFLPSACQGTRFSVTDSSQRNRPIDRMRRGEPNPNGIDNAVNPRLSRAEQREQLDLVQALHKEQLGDSGLDAFVEGAIENSELAFRMQDTVPAVMDLAGESAKTLEMYGINEEPTDGFGRQCLMARRFAEAGVRFIEVGHGSWDHHSNMQTALAGSCSETDKPIAGLIRDLKQRGLLNDTLVIWGGEFGRSPFSPDADGRDHNHKGYTIWMAGGGVKSGFSFGATDEHGYEATEGRMHIHDWHATVLHLLGLDHERLTYMHGGRAMRLTEVNGTVAHDVIG